MKVILCIVRFFPTIQSAFILFFDNINKCIIIAGKGF